MQTIMCKSSFFLLLTFLVLLSASALYSLSISTSIPSLFLEGSFGVQVVVVAAGDLVHYLRHKLRYEPI